jgi:uncharacterized protein YkwD
MRAVAILTAALLQCACGNGRQSVSPPSASPEAALTDGDELIIAELNQLRSNPTAYAEKINARRQYYRGHILQLPGQIALRTKEGVAAAEEAVHALRGLKPLPLLEASIALSAAARDHVRDIGPRGFLDHEGSDGSSPSQRIARYAKGFNRVAEVIGFGPEPSAVVIDLIVDDGVPERGHRKILLNENLRIAGAACGPHTVYRTVCVIDLADNLTETR